MNIQQIKFAIRCLDSLPHKNIKNSIENWISQTEGKLSITDYDNSLLASLSEPEQLVDLSCGAKEYLPTGTKYTLILPPGNYECRGGVKAHPGVIWKGIVA